MTRELFFLLCLVIPGLILFLIYNSKGLERAFKAEVRKAIAHVEPSRKDLLSEADIQHLPEPVQKYLRYVNAVGQEKVRNFRVTFAGEFRTNPKMAWAKMKGEQYTDLIDPTRLFFMELKMFGLPVAVLHKYVDAKATMLAKVAGLITVVDGRGPIMDEGETVTVFNDMCLLAPASLIDKRIEWELLDPLTVKGTFSNQGIKVSALLHFNIQGELINFISDDRYYSPTGKTGQKVRWSTPVQSYRDYRGMKLLSDAEIIWLFPEGEFSYGRFTIKEVEYNVNH